MGAVFHLSPCGWPSVFSVLMRFSDCPVTLSFLKKRFFCIGEGREVGELVGR